MSVFDWALFLPGFKDVDLKLKSRSYSNFSEFNSDINRVFENARKYHVNSSSEFQCCDIVEKEVVLFLTSFRQNISQGEDEERPESPAENQN